MPRSKNAVASKRRRKKQIERAAGYWGSRGNLLTVVKHAVDKGMQYAYRDRRAKKRTFRALWITRINAAAHQNGTSYSQFMDALHKSGLTFDRKVLADMAVNDAAGFSALVQTLTADRTTATA